MKFKLDENLGDIGKASLLAEGHDVMTIRDQGLSGPLDDRIYQVCRDEERVLITLDHDFGHTLRYPPDQTAGIVVLECRGRLSPATIQARIIEFIVVLRSQPIDRELWIVEPGRVRIHQQP